MSPYWRYQLDSCPAGGSSERSGDTSIRAGDEIGEDPKSSSKPESLNLDMSICFLCRAVCRCWTVVCASVGGEAPVVRLRLLTVSEPHSPFTNDTISGRLLSLTGASTGCVLSPCMLVVGEGSSVWLRQFSRGYPRSCSAPFSRRPGNRG